MPILVYHVWQERWMGQWQAGVTGINMAFNSSMTRAGVPSRNEAYITIESTGLPPLVYLTLMIFGIWNQCHCWHRGRHWVCLVCGILEFGGWHCCTRLLYISTMASLPCDQLQLCAYISFPATTTYGTTKLAYCCAGLWRLGSSATMLWIWPIRST